MYKPYEAYTTKLIWVDQFSRPKGTWKKMTGVMPPEFHGSYYCSECHELALRDWKTHKIVLSKFCPNCGSRNEEEK